MRDQRMTTDGSTSQRPRPGAMPQRVAVIGGGMMGLTAAWELVKRGVQVKVFEADTQPGGLCKSMALGGFAVDRYYHCVLPQDEHTLRLLDELGLSSRLKWFRPGSAVHHAGRTYPTTSAADLLRFTPLAFRDRVRLGRAILHARHRGHGADLDEQTALSWLGQLSGPQVTEGFWRPLLRARFGELADTIPATYVWAMMHRMGRARVGPAQRESIGSLDEPYQLLVDALVDALDARSTMVCTGLAVRRIVQRRVGGIYVETLDGAEGFDAAVVTAPPHRLSSLLPEGSPVMECRHELGVVCVVMLLHRPLSHYYTTAVTDPGIPFTSVIEWSNIAGEERFEGRHLVYAPRYAVSGSEWLEKSDEEIANRFWTGLRLMHPDLTPHDVSAMRVTRAPVVFSMPQPGSAPQPYAATKDIWVVNSAHVHPYPLHNDEVIRVAADFVESLVPARQAVRV